MQAQCSVQQLSGDDYSGTYSDSSLRHHHDVKLDGGAGFLCGAGMRSRDRERTNPDWSRVVLRRIYEADTGAGPGLFNWHCGVEPRRL